MTNKLINKIQCIITALKLIILFKVGGHWPL